MQPSVQRPVVKDVLIVGGGFAGLSAALTLYRALHTSVIFNSSPPRNAYGTLTHLTPGWDNKEPEVVLAHHRAELSQSGLVEFVHHRVEHIRKTDDGFEVVDSHGTSWHGRKLLLANGVRDVFPDLEGYRENYAKGMYVLYLIMSLLRSQTLMFIFQLLLHVLLRLRTARSRFCWFNGHRSS